VGVSEQWIVISGGCMKKMFEKIFTRRENKEIENMKVPLQEQTENIEEIYSADSPISNPDLDEFNRREYSERIARTIAARKETKSLVVGIYGKWGEGKTTVLNFIDSELRRHNNIVTIFFNPWMFPSESELFTAFYTELAQGLEKSLPTSKEKIGQVIADYLAPFAGLLDRAASAEKIGKLLSSVRLEELRDRIGKFLVGQKKFVVVFMDDIDRLDKDEIHAIFRLIKLSANFENIIYVLAFDPEIVEDALSERYFTKKKTAGQNFLEKIVQVPINLPKVLTTDLRRFCYEQVYKALKINEIEFSQNDWQEFSRGFIVGIEIKLETPRMAIRYGNMLNFSIPLLKGEVNMVEFLLIEAIRAFYPNAYEIIKNGRDAFTALSLAVMSPYPSEKEEIKKTVEKAFEGLTDDEINNLKRLLTILFPRQKTVYENTIYGSEWDKTWAEQKRIASDKYFDRYFTYSIPLGDVSDVRIENFIKTLDNIEPKDLVKALGNELTEQNAEVFISKLHQKIERITPTGQVKLAICLSIFGSKLPNPKELFSFRTPFSRGALLVAYLIEAQVKDEDKYGLAIEVMNAAEPITFAFEVVKWLRTKKTENESNAISPDNLLKICNTLATRIEIMFNQNTNVFEKYPDYAPHLLWFWGNFGSKENADEYLLEFLKADVQNVHRLLNSIVPIAYSADGSPPHKSDFERDQYNYLQSFVDLNLVFELLEKAYGNGLESEQYPYDFDKSLDLRLAKQFAWIHKKVRSEQQASEHAKPIE
jgi:predicted KAP-like P-loop ATPase